MDITLNGKPRSLATGTSIAELLNQLQLDCQQVVVENNRRIVSRQRHADTILQDGDCIEVVHFVGGG